MSYQDIKSFLYDLTDYEFLSSISNIDNYQKSIFMKPAFWNTFVSTFVDLVVNRKGNYIRNLCYRIKECMVWRLSIIRRRAFVKFFTEHIHVPINRFHNKLANYCLDILDVEQEYDPNDIYDDGVITLEEHEDDIDENQDLVEQYSDQEDGTASEDSVDRQLASYLEANSHRHAEIDTYEDQLSEAGYAETQTYEAPDTFSSAFSEHLVTSGVEFNSEDVFRSVVLDTRDPESFVNSLLDRRYESD